MLMETLNRRPKLLYSSGAVRAIVYPLPEDHQDYTEDTFEVVTNWIAPNIPLTEENKRVLESLKNSKIIEFKYGTYKVEPVYDRYNKKPTTKRMWNNYLQIDLNGLNGHKIIESTYGK